VRYKNTTKSAVQKYDESTGQKHDEKCGIKTRQKVRDKKDKISIRLRIAGNKKAGNPA